MPTNAELFEILHDWTVWNGADYGARLGDAEGRHATAADHRTFRNRRTVDPMQVLHATNDVIESLSAGRWDIITEARLRGATWNDVAQAMNQGPRVPGRRG